MAIDREEDHPNFVHWAVSVYGETSMYCQRCGYTTDAFVSLCMTNNEHKNQDDVWLCNECFKTIFLLVQTNLDRAPLTVRLVLEGEYVAGEG